MSQCVLEVRPGPGYLKSTFPNQSVSIWTRNPGQSTMRKLVSTMRKLEEPESELDLLAELRVGRACCELTGSVVLALSTADPGLQPVAGGGRVGPCWFLPAEHGLATAAGEYGFTTAPVERLLPLLVWTIHVMFNLLTTRTYYNKSM